MGALSSIHTRMDRQLPRGWTRRIAPVESGEPIPGNLDYHAAPYGFGSHIYKHNWWPSKEFWHPIPLDSAPGVVTSTPFLFSKVDRAWLRMGTRPFARRERKSSLRSAGAWHYQTREKLISLKDASGRCAGLLRLNDTADKAPKQQYAELVAISRGKASRSRGSRSVLPEVSLPVLPKRGESYEFYNVLWIKWDNGVASRQALGRVVRHVWERQPLERINLILN